MFIKWLFCLFFCFNSAFATVWITVADPKSQKMGAIGASSGYIGEVGNDLTTVIHVDNQALAVVGANYLGNDNRDLYAMLSAPYSSVTQLAEQFSERINRNSRRPRRVTLVTSKFETATAASWGCNQGNQYCNEYSGGHFAIAGGGLESEHVIASAVKLLSSPAVRKLPLECQLYLGIKAIFESGGEIKLFERIALIVDDLKLDNDAQRLIFYRNRWQEEWLLEQLEQHLRTKGYNCL